jgi:hypothetical protein
MMLFKISNKTKVNSIIKGNCIPSEMANLNKKTLILLVKKFNEWKNDNRNLSYKSREKIKNIYKDILILNSKSIDELNVYEEINSRNQIVFHGGCLGCYSQNDNGIKRCSGCQYFKAEWDKPNLSSDPSDHDDDDDTQSITRDIVLFKKNNSVLISKTCLLKKL